MDTVTTILLAVLVATTMLIPAPATADAITYTSTPNPYTLPENITCPPGSYGYNITGSGAYICVPPIQRLNTSMTSLVIIYNDTGIYVLASTMDPSGANITAEISLPNGTRIGDIDVSLGPGNTAWRTIPCNGSEPYIVVNITVNGYSMGVYAVKKQEAPVANIYSLSTLSPLVPLFFTVAVFAPIIGVMLRGDIKTGSLGMIAIAIIYTPVMTALGISPLIAGFISSLIIILGILILALNPR